MPKRPRGHIIEDKSSVAFQQLLPDDWLYRPLSKDYGIDGEVEIFDSEGNATAEKFLVQLKSTESDLRNKLYVNLRIEHIKYYLSHDLPIIIALYHVPSDSFFIRWAHTCEITNKPSGSKYIKIRFIEDHRWSAETARHLFLEYKAIRDLRSTSISLPIRFYTYFDRKWPENIPQQHIRINLLEEIETIRNVVEIGENIDQKICVNIIEFYKKEIAIYMAGEKTFSITANSYRNKEQFLNEAHYDICVAIGISIFLHGHLEPSFAVLKNFWKLSRMSETPQTLLLIASCFIQSNHFSHAIQLADSLLSKNFDTQKVQAFVDSISLRHRKNISSDEEKFLYEVYTRIAQKTRDDDLRGIVHYNCGNFLISRRKFSKAVYHYRKAAEFREDYKQKFYFWKELAGIFFESGHFSVAARAYACSIKLIPNKLKLRPLYADSLMFCGDYVGAEREWNAYLSTATIETRDTEWQLKLLALRFLMEATGLSHQKRKTQTAFAVLGQCESPEACDDEHLEQLCKNAISQDALCALAWFNLGGVRSRLDDPPNAAFCYLIAALIVPGDLEAWYNVMAISHNLDDNELFAASFIHSCCCNGAKAMRLMSQRLPGSSGREFLAGIEDLYRKVLIETSSDDKSEIRLHLPDGTFRSLNE
ncbi:MAG: DUF4365 domain-containing protein [Pseudomonadota bacterium]